MKDEPESQLVQRVKNGEQSAIRQVLDDHLGPLTHYVARMMHNAAETEDIVQETFVRFWTKLDSYDANQVKLSTWLHRIAHNLCIDHFRKTPKGQPDQQDDETNDGPESDYLSGLDADRLEHALMQLNEHHRSAIVMCHYQGLKNSDVALILGVSVEALESTLRRARAKFAQYAEQPNFREHTMSQILAFDETDL